MPLQTITTKRPQIPAGFRKIKQCKGGYKPSIIGKQWEAENPLWAEPRYDKNAIFKDDRKYYRIYTYIKE